MPLFGPPDVKKLEAKRNVKGLIKALNYERDAKVRGASARALGRTSDVRAVEPLITALKDGVGEVREAAALALDILKWKPDKGEAGIAYWIQKGKNKNNQMVRQSAINALGQIGSHAVEPLIAELKSGDWITSSNAAAALGLIGDSRAVQPLIVAITLYGETNSVVHSAAVRALGQIGDPRAVEPLITTLRNETSKVHEAAVEALGRIGGVALEPLIAVLTDGNSIVRAAAIKAIGQTGDPRAVEPLIAALKDTDSYPRWTAAEALGQIGDSRTVEPLIATLKDTELSVRRRAAETLDQLGWKPGRSNAGAWYWIAKRDNNECVAIGAVAVEPLIAVLKDKNADVRKDAASVLVQIGAAAVEPLIAILHDGDANVRKAAVKALGEIGDPQAVESIIAVLKDPEEIVREQSAEVLGQIGDARAVEPLIAVLKDEVRNVRERAATSLMMMYKMERFDEQVKSVILTQANKIKKWERDSHHDHTDDSWGGCFGDAYHNDTALIDPGFHADFTH